MLTWFRNRWPDPRIAERERELREMVERHESGNKEWSRKLKNTVDDTIQLLRQLDETRGLADRFQDRAVKAEKALSDRPVIEKPVEVQKPVYIDKIVERPVELVVEKIVEKIIVKANAEVLEDNRVLAKKLELALGRLHGWDHLQAISIEKMKAKDL